MEHLHAYWRMEYVAAPKPPSGPGEAPAGSIFSRLLAQGVAAATLVVFIEEHAFAVLNRFPYNAGHLLVLPRREVAELTDLTPTERAALFEAVVRGQELLRAAFRPEGFNVGLNLGKVAGAGVPGHLHVHVVPRWGGDSNFMPVVSDTRVLPMALEGAWQRLQTVLRDLGQSPTPIA